MGLVKAFNAFQIVVLFACMPFIMGWLKTNPFAYATPLLWIAVPVYLVLFIFIISCVASVIFDK